MQITVYYASMFMDGQGLRSHTQCHVTHLKTSFSYKLYADGVL